MLKLSLWRSSCIAFVLLIATTVPGATQTLTTLASFDGANGANPDFMTLVQGFNGNLYGTTYQGGSGTGCFGGSGPGCGTVFEITPTGNLNTLYSFCSQPSCTDGYFPMFGLVQASDGNLYGTTEGGGASYNYGTVFKISSTGKLTTLYSFCSLTNCTDGSNPYGALVQATNGNFYGTTATGGANRQGTVFSVTPAGKLTVLYSFCQTSGCSDGSEPYAGLIQARDGSFYGTTYSGGVNGQGVIFRITAAGALTTLYSFCSLPNCADGYVSFAPLLQDTDGTFYGTTAYGGATGCCGTVFRFSSTDGFASLYSFCSLTNCADGDGVYSGLTLGTDGNLYGVSGGGGANGGGTAFRITTAGVLTTLYSFCFETNCVDGGGPQGIIQDTDGVLYGATYYGGTGPCETLTTQGCGTVFRLSDGLEPFVTASPAAAKVGAEVWILGTSLTSTTSVTFNGTPARFSVQSASLITAEVPSGATTGYIKVTTGSRSVRSKAPFELIQ